MASSGADAWRKYFKDKGVVDTVMKSDSSIYDQNGALIGSVKANDPVKVLESAEYQARYPIQTKTGVTGFVTFNNIRKPQTTKATAGIKLKPQDFNCIMNTPSFKYKKLAQELINDLDERTDLDPKTVNYLIALTKYWAGIDNVNAATVSSLYDSQLSGLAEIQKDYGEMLGAIACVNKNLLSGVGYTLDSNASLIFPVRGNEPIVDYYIQPTTGNKISISAKSGDTTNTLKPQHILSLLKENNKQTTWMNKPVYKIIQLVSEKSIAQLPFYAINQLFPKTLSDKAIKEVDSKFKPANFQTKTYDSSLFIEIFKLLGFDATKPPKIGELFYAGEAFVCKKLNELYSEDNKKIFKDATSALVIYVKFKVTPAKPYGEFEILSSDATSISKQDIKWRPKNSQNRAGDKIGLQP